MALFSHMQKSGFLTTWLISCVTVIVCDMRFWKGCVVPCRFSTQVLEAWPLDPRKIA